MRGPIDVLFAFKIFSLPVPTRPGTQTFGQVPDPSRPEVKNPYPSDPDYNANLKHKSLYDLVARDPILASEWSPNHPKVCHLLIIITTQG